MTPVRIQLSRARGWRMPENTVSVARPGRWGNPYSVEVFGRRLAIDLFRNTVEGYWSPALVAQLSDELARAAYERHTELQRQRLNRSFWILRGRNLACWCKPGAPCHADVLLELANAPAADGVLGNAVCPPVARDVINAIREAA